MSYLSNGIFYFSLILSVISMLCSCTVMKEAAIKREQYNGMVYIPKGSFIMGASEADGRAGIDIGYDELPKQTVYLDAFYIDRYETTVAEYIEFLDKTGHQPPLLWFTDEFYPYHLKEELDHPIRDLSWHDAAAYCKWKGKRLPTEAEWEKAARGAAGRKYPWGDEFDAAKCNIKSERGKKGDIYWTMPVGSFPDGVSPYGVHDMCGNVAEWTDSWYEPYKGSKLDMSYFGDKRWKVLRGGWYESDIKPMSDRFSYILDEDATLVGVRCAL